VAYHAVGVDLGQSNDRSAVVVLQQQPTRQRDEWRDVPDPHNGLPSGTKQRFTITEPTVFHAVIIDRLPVGMPYPDQVQALKRLVTKQLVRNAVDLVVDRTGVGAPVVDLLVKEGLRPIGVTITGGEVVTGGSGRVSVPKRELVSAAVVAFQSGRIKIPKEYPETRTLTKELLAFKPSIDPVTRHDSYGGVGQHDDLVMSFALAAWWAFRHRPEPSPWVSRSYTTL
jgi:hypothetical protein